MFVFKGVFLPGKRAIVTDPHRSYEKDGEILDLGFIDNVSSYMVRPL